MFCNAKEQIYEASGTQKSLTDNTSLNFNTHQG